MSRPAARLHGATLRYGDRTLWSGLDLDVAPGEFIAILGPNGSGKSSLLRAILGETPLTSGGIEIAGEPVRGGGRRGSDAARLGYVPQQDSMADAAGIRGRDLVALGVDGPRWGLGLSRRRSRRATVDAALAAVDATTFADAPLDLLSGGERQRLRIAQALIGDPAVLLCDEPLLALDPASQELVADLIDGRRRSHDTAVLFVTHEINPVLRHVDRVLYLAAGHHVVGRPDDVLTSEQLSALYGAPVDVVRVHDRIIIAGTDEACHHQRTAIA